MQALTATEFIQEDASLDQALHQMVMGRHASLLVKKGDSVVGILRQSDVFKEICDRMKACGI
jgi:predicted transcriptional regulator